MQSKFLPFLMRSFFLFALFFLILQLLGVGKTAPEIQEEDVVIMMQESFSLGDTVKLSITNNLEDSIDLMADCPNEPFSVLKYANGEWVQQKAVSEHITCEPLMVASGETQELSYNKWNHLLFHELETFRIEVPITIDGKEKVFYREFSIVEPSFFKQFWNNFFYKPIYNTLVYFITILPETNNFGFAIILLTVLIKLLLLIPNNKAIKAQKDLQKVQPLLQEIQKKYKDDKQKIAEETMKIWKKHKVNPFGSCIPLIIQFPILIGLFYVVQSGLDLSENSHLLYSFINIDSTIIDPTLFGILDLTQNHVYALAITIGALQYFQMKISMSMNNQKNKPQKSDAQAVVMSKTMTYVLPFMIAFFSFSLPAAVGLYWGISTLFALVQQHVLNKTYS